MLLRLGIICLFISLLAVSPVLAENAADYYREADMFYNQKDYNRAFDVYQTTVNLDPTTSYRAYVGMGNCQYALNKKEKALEYYQKSLTLHQDNPTLAQFVMKLKTELAAKGTLYFKGHLLFEQKKYAEAIPFYQQALQDDTQNLQAYYELGFSQYMTNHKPEAALNFAYYGAKETQPVFQDYADRMKAGLSADDRDWMDDQLKNGPPFSSPFRYSGFGVRVEPAFQGSNLKDFSDYATSLQAFGHLKTQADSTFQMTATSPAGGFAMDLNPFVQVAENMELGLTFGYLFLGQFNATYQSDSGTGNGVIDYQIYDGGLSFRAHFLKQNKGKISFFADGNPVVYHANLHVANSDTTSGWGFIPVTGDFSGTAVGGRLKVGVDWKPVANSLISGFVGYQYVKISGFKGTGTDNSATSSVAGQLEMLRDSTGASLQFIPDSSAPALPAGASLSPLTMDFSGIMLGLDLTVLL